MGVSENRSLFRSHLIPSCNKHLNLVVSRQSARLLLLGLGVDDSCSLCCRLHLAERLRHLGTLLQATLVRAKLYTARKPCMGWRTFTGAIAHSTGKLHAQRHGKRYPALAHHVGKARTVTIVFVSEDILCRDAKRSKPRTSDRHSLNVSKLSGTLSLSKITSSLRKTHAVRTRTSHRQSLDGGHTRDLQTRRARLSLPTFSSSMTRFSYGA